MADDAASGAMAADAVSGAACAAAARSREEEEAELEEERLLDEESPRFVNLKESPRMVHRVRLLSEDENPRFVPRPSEQVSRVRLQSEDADFGGLVERERSDTNGSMGEAGTQSWNESIASTSASLGGSTSMTPSWTIRNTFIEMDEDAEDREGNNSQYRRRQSEPNTFKPNTFKPGAEMASSSMASTDVPAPDDRVLDRGAPGALEDREAPHGGALDPARKAVGSGKVGPRVSHRSSGGSSAEAANEGLSLSGEVSKQASRRSRFSSASFSEKRVSFGPMIEVVEIEGGLKLQPGPDDHASPEPSWVQSGAAGFTASVQRRLQQQQEHRTGLQDVPVRATRSSSSPGPQPPGLRVSAATVGSGRGSVGAHAVKTRAAGSGHAAHAFDGNDAHQDRGVASAMSGGSSSSGSAAPAGLGAEAGPARAGRGRASAAAAAAAAVAVPPSYGGYPSGPAPAPGPTASRPVDEEGGMRRLAFVVESVRAALAASAALVVCAETKEGPRGWTVTGYVRREALKTYRDQLLLMSQQALFQAAGLSQTVFVLGYASNPFSPMPLGFGAAIADMPDRNSACWSSISHGFCGNPSGCRAVHPKCRIGINVMLKPARGKG